MRRGRRRRARPAGGGHGSAFYIAPLLAGALVIMIGCVTERFWVNQMSMENRQLSIRLRELTEEVSRMERRVSLLASRDRIERIAGEDLGLRLSSRSDQVLLPAWRKTETHKGTGESLMASLFFSAGRGIEQIVFARGGDGGE